jgi:hypothetical protein
MSRHIYKYLGSSTRSAWSANLAVVAATTFSGETFSRMSPSISKDQSSDREKKMEKGLLEESDGPKKW